MNYQTVKGCEDFYPEDQAKLNYIFGKLRETALRFGFLEVEPPLLENFKLLSAKSGEEIKEQIFMLEKRSNEELSLRPEFTPGFARMFIAKQKQLPKPVKWFCINRVWRYEAPQKGRAREFFQLNVELYGSDKPDADAEILRLAIESLRAFGLTEKDFCIKINSRKLLTALITQTIPETLLDAVLRVIDKVDKITPAAFDAELAKIGLAKKQIETVRDIITLRGSPSEILPKLAARKDLGTAKEALEELTQVCALAPTEFVRIDLSIVRGLAYYTGMVFEAADKDGKLRAIAGGGRYDNLIDAYGGEKTPATGFAMGDKVLSLFLDEKKLLPKAELGPEYYIAPVDEKMIPKAVEIANALRAKYTVDIDLMRRKLAKQFDYANSLGAKKVVVVGEKDLKENNVTIKNLATGKEEKVLVNSLLK